MHSREDRLQWIKQGFAPFVESRCGYNTCCSYPMSEPNQQDSPQCLSSKSLSVTSKCLSEHPTTLWGSCKLRQGYQWHLWIRRSKCFAPHQSWCHTWCHCMPSQLPKRRQPHDPIRGQHPMHPSSRPNILKGKAKEKAKASQNRNKGPQSIFPQDV